jgi:hypothetical protein
VLLGVWWIGAEVVLGDQPADLAADLALCTRDLLDDADAAAAGAGRAAAADTAPSTSPLVTRPSRPVPGTDPAASWLSAMSLAAAGKLVRSAARDNALQTGKRVFIMVSPS